MPITKVTNQTTAQCSVYQCAVDALEGQFDPQRADAYTQCKCGELNGPPAEDFTRIAGLDISGLAGIAAFSGFIDRRRGDGKNLLHETIQLERKAANKRGSKKAITLLQQAVRNYESLSLFEGASLAQEKLVRAYWLYVELKHIYIDQMQNDDDIKKAWDRLRPDIDACSAAYVKLGDLYDGLRYRHQANETYQRALDPFRELSAPKPGPEALARAYFKLAKHGQSPYDNYSAGAKELMSVQRPGFAIENKYLISSAARHLASVKKYELAVKVMDHVADLYERDGLFRESAEAHFEAATYILMDKKILRPNALVRLFKAWQGMKRARGEFSSWLDWRIEGNLKFDHFKKILYIDLQSQILAAIDPSEQLEPKARNKLAETRFNQLLPTLVNLFRSNADPQSCLVEYERFKSKGGIQYVLGSMERGEVVKGGSKGGTSLYSRWKRHRETPSDVSGPSRSDAVVLKEGREKARGVRPEEGKEVDGLKGRKGAKGRGL